MNKNKVTIAAVLMISALSSLFGPVKASAAYDVYAPGVPVTLGEFVYDDDYNPSGAACTVTVTNPNGTVAVNAASMAFEANGWHHYTFTPDSIEGIWPAEMTCGAAISGDLVKGDKTFEIRAGADAVEIDEAAIASSVWSNPTRTLTSAANVAGDIWNNSTRTLTAFGSLAADVWNTSFSGTRRLTDSTLSAGGTLGTESFITTSLSGTTTTITSAITSSTSTINSSINTAVNGAITTLSSAITASTNTINSSIADLQDAIEAAIVDSRDVITAAISTSQTAITTALTNSEDSIKDELNTSIEDAADDAIAQLNASISASQTAIESTMQDSTDNIITEVLANRTLIENLNNISAADVWAHGSRSINSPVDISSGSQLAIWNVASSSLSTNGSIGKQLADNINAQITSRGTSNLTAADVWNAATRTLSDYSEDSVALAVWADSSRTLTNYGNNISAADVWNVLSSSLNQVGSIGNQLSTNVDVATSTRASSVTQLSDWTVQMSNVERIQTGRTYRAKVIILNNQSAPTAPFATPSISLYDPSRNSVVSNISMTSIGTGVYEYTYSVSGSAEQGLWEAVVNTQVESGKTIQTNDYWEVSGSPAQVLINSMGDTTTPDITANITITNEGLTGYEYQYEWCVVTDANNACGGNNDVYRGTAAKFINPGEDFNTTLTATVPNAGNYIFKLVVYFGTENSKSSRSFTATGTQAPGGGGGGGGGSGSGSTTNPPTTPTQPTDPDAAGKYLRSDLNTDYFVNSIDFSILLFFWKTAAPFKNPRVDINADKEVNSVDFSILLFEWNKPAPNQ